MVYQRAADRLLDSVRVDAEVPLRAQIVAGLDAHFDFFLANRHAMLAANQTLATDPVIQGIINAELDTLRDRIAQAVVIDDVARQRISSLVISWLAFVRVLSVQWLVQEGFTRGELWAICVNALSAVLPARI